jgi:hypothetical protein
MEIIQAVNLGTGSQTKKSAEINGPVNNTFTQARKCDFLLKEQSRTSSLIQTSRITRYELLSLYLDSPQRLQRKAKQYSLSQPGTSPTHPRSLRLPEMVVG